MKVRAKQDVAKPIGPGLSFIKGKTYSVVSDKKFIDADMIIINEQGKHWQLVGALAHGFEIVDDSKKTAPKRLTKAAKERVASLEENIKNTERFAGLSSGYLEKQTLNNQITIMESLIFLIKNK